MAGLVPAIYCGTGGAQISGTGPAMTPWALRPVRQSFRDPYKTLRHTDPLAHRPASPPTIDIAPNPAHRPPHKQRNRRGAHAGLHRDPHGRLAPGRTRRARRGRRRLRRGHDRGTRPRGVHPARPRRVGHHPRRAHPLDRRRLPAQPDHHRVQRLGPARQLERSFRPRPRQPGQGPQRASFRYRVDPAGPAAARLPRRAARHLARLGNRAANSTTTASTTRSR